MTAHGLPTARLSRFQIMALIGLHVILGAAADLASVVSTVHGLVALSYGLYLAITSRRADRLTAMVVYIGCFDVFWRMTEASLLWEFGKYASIAIMLIAGLRRSRLGSAAPWATAYLLALLPGAIVTISLLSLANAKDALSFNLSGPLTLGIGLCFFSGVASYEIDFDKLLLAIGLAATTTGAVAARGTLTASSFSFGNAANFTASGGYGPNQVSALLCAGTLVFLLLFMRTRVLSARLIYSGIALGLLLQAVLTFSRGGVFNLAICLAVLTAHYLRRPRQRALFLAFFSFAFALAYFVAIPALDSFTGGAFEERFTSLNSTGRAEIASQDVELFLENPVLGTGAGLASYERFLKTGWFVAPHTEYTRLLAEHGAFGVLALLILLGTIATRWLVAPSIMTRSFILTFCAWSLATMMHAGMRIAAISILFALCAIEWRQLPRPLQRKAASR